MKLAEGQLEAKEEHREFQRDLSNEPLANGNQMLR